MTRSLLPAALAALALAGCNSGFEPQYRVEDLRILALRAEVQGSSPSAADAIPGDTLVLDALVANPLARAGLLISWFGCFPRASEALSACEESALLADPSLLAADPRVTPLGTGASRALPIDPAGVTSALSFVTGIALSEPAFACRLYAEVVVVAVAEAEGRRVVAKKRVRVTPPESALEGTLLEGAYVPNLNPAIAAVTRAPTDRDTCAGATALGAGSFPATPTVLCGIEGPGSSGTFNVCTPASASDPTIVREPETEDLSWQWYATGGEFPEFDGGVGNATGRDVEFTRPAQPFTLWVILRDGRGGEGWATFAVP